MSWPAEDTLALTPGCRTAEEDSFLFSIGTAADNVACSSFHSCSVCSKNYQHGELYFGVKADGTPIGQAVTEESLRGVSQKIKNFIEPPIYPEINKVIIDDKECIHVKFEGIQVPYFAYGVARICVADEDLKMSPEQITDLLLKSGREGSRWENLVLKRMSR